MATEEKGEWLRGKEAKEEVGAHKRRRQKDERVTRAGGGEGGTKKSGNRRAEMIALICLRE